MNLLINILQIIPVDILSPDITLLLMLGGVVILALLAFPLWIWMTHKRFLRSLKKLALSPPGDTRWFFDTYTTGAILRKTPLIEKFAEENDRRIVHLTGADDLWIRELRLSGRRKDFRRVLKYAPEKGLFPCFTTALQNKDLAVEITEWLKQDGEFLPLRKLGLAASGDEFDGKTALQMLADWIDQIRELAGDPEWIVRQFAINILIYDTENPRSKIIVEESLMDPRPQIRKFAIEHISESDFEPLYEALENAFLKDPVFTVRFAAIQKIRRHFADRLSIEPDKLQKEEVLHVIEQLRKDNADDQSTALYFLDSDNMEYRLPAANFLSECGVLNRLALELHAGDTEAIDRSKRLLKKALEVNESSFFSVLETSNNPATLLLCGRLLLETDGRREAVTNLARKGFALSPATSGFNEIYTTALQCIKKRGNTDSFQLYNKELKLKKDNPEHIKLLLENLPPEASEILKNTITGMIQDDSFTETESLETAAVNLPRSLIIPELLKILKSVDKTFSREIQKRALRILSRFNLPYTLQTIIEHLPSLEADEAKDYVQILARFPEEELNYWIEHYLKGIDSPLRAAIILALPALENRKHTREIKKAIKDSDPDVRIAAVYSLVALKESEVLEQQSPVLRDPVERVRMESAKILGANASEKVIHTFGEIIDDEDESPSVKTAAIQGLAFSPHKASIDLLINSIDKEGQDPQFKIEMLNALSKKREKNQVKFILEKFKDATPRLRQDLTSAFQSMGEPGATAMTDLMEEDIPSLKPFIIEVLENTGTIENNIRKLRHRDPARRNEAASFLSSVGSKSAFRGLVMAAQDPDENVRILVIRALESLETEDGKKLLEDLQNDPDRRVRKYTHWAMERLKAKSE